VNYSTSSQDLYSRQNRCSAQNRALYRTLHRRQGSSTTQALSQKLHTPTPLPPRLVSQALFPLPDATAYLFAQALQSPENLDESELGQWDNDLPYLSASSHVLDSQSERRFTDKLVEVMHGRRLRQERERNTQLAALPSSERVEAIRKELLSARVHWESLDKYLPNYLAGDRERRMAEHLLHWCARTALRLHERLQKL
jgi:hypothetical protein